MEILILSHRQFTDLMKKHNLNDENVEQKERAAFISIIDTQKTSLLHWFKSDHKNVLNLKFDDIDTKTLVAGDFTAKGFSIEQGKKVLNFLEDIDTEKTKILVVHCAAGVSRSGAVGTFANDFFGLDFKKFTNDNKYIHPNGRVMRIMKRLQRGIEVDE